jgi:hypothetical protein
MPLELLVEEQLQLRDGVRDLVVLVVLTRLRRG